MAFQFCCPKCRDQNYYLVDKQNGTGIATGMYCSNCHSWIKWVSKKEHFQEIVEGADYYEKLPVVQPEPSIDKEVILDIIATIEHQIKVMKKMLGVVEEDKQENFPSYPQEVPHITCEPSTCEPIQFNNKTGDRPPWED